VWQSRAEAAGRETIQVAGDQAAVSAGLDQAARGHAALELATRSERHLDVNIDEE
jgi:hypothetical protein